MIKAIVWLVCRELGLTDEYEIESVWLRVKDTPVLNVDIVQTIKSAMREETK